MLMLGPRATVVCQATNATSMEFTCEFENASHPSDVICQSYFAASQAVTAGLQDPKQLVVLRPASVAVSGGTSCITVVGRRMEQLQLLWFL